MKFVTLNYQYMEFYRYMMMKWRQLMSSLHCLRTALSRILYWFFIIIKHFKKTYFQAAKLWESTVYK